MFIYGEVVAILGSNGDNSVRLLLLINTFINCLSLHSVGLPK